MPLYKSRGRSDVVYNTLLTSHFTMDLLRNRRTRATSIAQSSDGSSVSDLPSSVSPPETWVDVDISTTDYARRRRELMEMMTDLRSMG